MSSAIIVSSRNPVAVVLPWTARIGGVETHCPEFRGRLRDWRCPVQPPDLPGATLVEVPGAGRRAADVAEDDEE